MTWLYYPPPPPPPPPTSHTPHASVACGIVAPDIAVSLTILGLGEVGAVIAYPIWTAGAVLGVWAFRLRRAGRLVDRGLAVAGLVLNGLGLITATALLAV